MLVYNDIKKNFMTDVELDQIVDRIHNKYLHLFGKSGKAQLRSWNNSMQYMYKVLNDKNIPDDSGIAIEFNIPSTSKRVDFIISGFDVLNKDSIIIIELKQWEKCDAIADKDGIVSTYIGGNVREVTHPSYQAWSYSNLISDYNLNVQKENMNLYPCAYLHNYQLDKNDPINCEQYSEYLEKAPLFGHGDVLKLRDFIKKYISYGDNTELLHKIDNGKIKPSKRLQDSLVKMLEGNSDFLMIDEQKVIFEDSIRMAIDTVSSNEKNVLIIKGGPGTGKSVVAINLLVELISRGMVCNYVTKNSAPREVFFSKLKKSFKQVYIKNLFKGSGNFVDVEGNVFDCLIVDEAHRLNEKSGLFSNLGENQIKEIINASKLSVFFIDEQQKVTLKDIGDTDLIVKYARDLNAGCKIMELESQFRCNGSDGYLAWLDNVLEIKNNANNYFDFDYDFKIFDDPVEMKEHIKKMNNNNNASRLVAGYCWDWISSGKNKTEVFDINMPEYNFHMSWNLANSPTWAIDETSVDEIGCIHTCQGLEFDYVGVIIGDDMRYESGKIITDFNRRARTDYSLKGIKKINKEDPVKAKYIADKIIKNTYRTLMTRGMKGCYIFCTDKKLREYLKKRLETRSEHETIYNVFR